MQCSVCNKKPSVKVLTTTKGIVNICEECNTRLETMKGPKKVKLPSPAEIKAHLDEYVIDQHEAKKVLSVAVYNHYKRVNFSTPGIELSKSNVLMIGPTGTGKTLVARTLARALDVPFAAADATALLSGGGRGLEEKVVAPLAQVAGYDAKKTESGIIYIDEIDKIAKKGHNMALGESIQQSLLKIIEGTVATIPVQGEKRTIQVDTSNILFIVGGAFVDLEQIVLMRFGGGVAIGSMMTHNELLAEITPTDIVKFGLIPEFVGRLPVIVTLNELNRETLITILTEPKNALVKQYETKFKLDGIDLIFERDSLELIADKALKLKTGARGLRTIIEDAMLDIMYKAPSEKNLNRITISKDVIEKSGDAVFQYVEATEEKELVSLEPKVSRNKAAT